MASNITPSHFITYPSGIGQQHVEPLPQFTYGNLPILSPSGLKNQGTAIMQVPVVPVGGGYYNDGMEVVWHGEFSRLFCTFYPLHVWYMSITDQAPGHKWKFHRDSAKVRFCCQDCGNGWTSMKGRVTFWFYLDHQYNSGFVQFKLYGQQCRKCNSGKFEYVMWYPEEISKVMCNVYNKIGQTFYGFQQPRIRIDRRPGRPRNQHNADLCQACKDGECDRIRSNKTSTSSAIHGQSLASVSNNTTSCQNSTTPIIPVSSVQDRTASVDETKDNVRSTSLPESNINCLPLSEAKPPVYDTPINTIHILTPSTRSSMQQIITYSLIGGPPMTAPLGGSSTQFVSESSLEPPVAPQYVYHPNPIIHQTVPLHQPSMHLLPRHRLVSQTEAKPLPRDTSIEGLAKAMETIQVLDKSNSCRTNQANVAEESEVVSSSND